MAEFNEQELLDGAKTAFNLDVNGWELMVDEQGFKAWRTAEEGSSLYKYRASGVIKAPPAVYFDFYRDLDYWQEWDENVDKLEVIGSEAGGDVTQIYWAVKYPFPFTNRDYVYKRYAKYNAEQKVWVICCKTYVDPKFPEAKRVRVDTYRTQIYIKENAEGHTELVLDYYEDPKMSIPTWALNWVSSKALPAFLKKLSEKTMGYTAYLAKKKK